MSPRFYSECGRFACAFQNGDRGSRPVGVVVDLGYLKPDDVATCRECSDHVIGELRNLLKAVSRFAS